MSEVSTLLADRAKAGGWWHAVPDVLVGWDQSVFDAVRATDKTSALYEFADLMAHRWPGIVVILALLWYLFRSARWPRPGLKVAWIDVALFVMLLAIANFLSDEAKQLFGRLKPHVSHDIPGGKQPLSFPSNHSFNTASILGYWIYQLKPSSTRTRVIGIALLTLLWAFTAWTRVYLGEHFPLDVIGGFLMGSVYGFYGAWLLSLSLRSLGKRAQK